MPSSGAGVFELAPAGVLGEDLDGADREMDWMLRLAAEIDRPVTFAMIQHDQDPDQWKRMLDLALEVHDRGVPIRPQVAGRPLGLLLGLQTFHPLRDRPSYQAIDRLPLDEKVARSGILRSGPRSWRSPRNPTTSWRSSAWGSTGCS